jgi:hypothetical protein
MARESPGGWKRAAGYCEVAMKLHRKKTVPIDADRADALRGQREAFVEKFGREPGPEDPLFFDPDCDTPRPLDHDKVQGEMVEAMVAAGIDPRLIYAFRRTGLLVTEENLDRLSSRDLRDWRAAIEEYDRLQRKSH